jgi:hypothetical protein
VREIISLLILGSKEYKRLLLLLFGTLGLGEKIGDGEGGG